VSNIGFQVMTAHPELHAAIPTIRFGIQVESPGDVVHSVALHCQIRIEPQRRRYTPTEEERLLELFGETPRWGDTLKPFLWTHVSIMLPGFTDRTEIVLPVPCSYDLEVAGAKYFHSLDDGEIPLLFLFSGTIFGKSPAGLQVAQVPWHKDSSFRLPVQIWRDVMNLYFPNSGWLRLQRETLDGLLRFKANRALTTFDEAVGVLLAHAEAVRQ
jgi:Family of unknown function (DUF6084)